MTKRVFTLATATVALGLLFPVPSALYAQVQQEQQQQRCELEPSERASRAQALVNEAREAETRQAARAKYEQALQSVQGADDPASLIMGATAQIGLGEYEAADQLLDRFVQVAPTCAEPAENTRYNAWVGLYNEAITAYQAGDAETALDRFETANLIYEDARSLNNAAFLHQQQGETEEAIRLYRRAVETDGDEEQVRNALTHLGDLLAVEDRVDEALAAYESYLERSPDDLVAKIRYALLLGDQGRDEDAAPLFEEVLAGEDLSNEQWNQVGVGLFNAQRYEQALMAFRRAHEANPYNKEALENLVASLIQADMHAEAEEPARTLVERYPYDEANFQLLANVLAMTGRGQEALQVMELIDDAPMAFQSVQMAETGEGRYLLRGNVEGRESGAGTSITVPIELLALDGGVITSQAVQIEVPPAGETADFQTTIETDQEAAGFRYRKAGSDGIQD